MSSVGRISLDLNVNNRGFNRQVDNIQRQTTRAFSAMSVAVGNIMSIMIQKAVSAIGNFAKDCIEKGSELSELQNVVDSVFTTMADRVEKFSKSALDAYGLTEKQAKKMVGTYGAMSKAFGYTEAQAYDMSTALTGLTGDVASFYNLDHDVAYTKLKSVFTGETESLKELGIVMTQAALQEFALQKGYKKTIQDMTEKEKVALRLAFVQEKLNVAAGDFTKTQGQWANQTRILTGQFESFKAAIGQGLINVLTPVVKVLNTIMAKLVQVGEAFKSFTEMLMGKKSSGSVGAAMTEVADAATTAAGATGGIEDAANGAADAAKKAQKSLMGFDEINRLTKSTDSSGSGESYDFSGMGLSEMATEGTLAEKSIEGLKGKVQELIDLFKSGFSAGLGDGFAQCISNIKGHISGIKSELTGIFTAPEVTKAASGWAKNVIYATGQATGAMVSVGATMAEALVGGVDTYLSQNSGFIKDRLVGMFDVAGECSAVIGDVFEAIASIFEVFRGPETKQIIGDLIAIVGNASLGAAELALKLGKDIVDCIAQPIIDNKDKIKKAIENTLKPVSGILKTLRKSVEDTFNKIKEVYDASIGPMFDAFADGFSTIAGSALDAYNAYITPVLDALASKFSGVWSNSVQPILDKAIELIGKICDLITVLWNQILAPFVDWIVQTLVPVLAPIFQTIIDVFLSVFECVSNVIGGILDALGGLIDFIVGVFTGDWELAWEGIKSIFSGIWDAIVGILEGAWNLITGIIEVAIDVITGIITVAFDIIKGIVTTVWDVIKTIFTTVIDAITAVVEVGFNIIKGIIEGVMDAIMWVISGVWNAIAGIINGIFAGIEFLVNGIIGGINFIIGALNMLSFDVPDWVPLIGGETFGFNISEISEVSLPRLPKLAEGGYVKANQPQPVIVGDNKRHGEIIAPEDKILAVTLQALEQFFGRLKESGFISGNEKNDVGDIVIPIYLDGSALEEVVVTAQQRRNMRSGGR